MACVFRDFVNYLNTLHRHGGDNINATAEANSQSEFAKDLLCEDKRLIEAIVAKLENPECNKVILTGYAGDGKTTLAELIVKRISKGTVKCLDSERIVVHDDNSGSDLIVIKDLSAGTGDGPGRLFEDITGSSSLLLVSNTGTIMDKLLSLSNLFMISKTELKKSILAGLKGGNTGFEGEICLGSTSLHVFNLVRHDNLETARQVLLRILEHPAWNVSPSKESVSYINVQLMKANRCYAVDRIFDVYRRLYAYGERLTMRQFIEHFAFTITGGKGPDKTMNIAKAYFFQNFFGERFPKSGRDTHDNVADEIKAIQIVCRAPFGVDISAKWRRNLWIGDFESPLDEEFSYECLPEVRLLFDGIKTKYMPNAKASPIGKAMRMLLTRIHFFLTRIDDDFARREFISSFLCSPGFEYMEEFRINGELSAQSEEVLFVVLRNCLRDFMLGMRMPISDSDRTSEDMYVSMSRNIPEISQTAQILEGEFSWRYSYPDLKYDNDAHLMRLSFEIRGQRDVCLDITLPFLDYLLCCNKGLVDDEAYAMFQKRLESLKTRISSLTPSHNLSIVFLNVDHSIKKTEFSIDNAKETISVRGCRR